MKKVKLTHFSSWVPSTISYWFALAFMLFATQGFGQYSTNLNCTTAFNDISATGTPLNLTDDGEFNLPAATVGAGGPAFDFDFYGVAVNDFNVGNNGGVLFNNPAGQIGTNNFAPLAGGLNGAYAFWDDLDDETGNVFHQTIGTSPNRTFIVQWEDRPHFNGVVGQSITFQIQFSEGSDLITFVYDDVVFGGTQAINDFGADATIGLSGGAGSTPVQSSFNDGTLLMGTTCISYTPTDCFPPTAFTSAGPTSTGIDVDVASVNPGASYTASVYLAGGFAAGDPAVLTLTGIAAIPTPLSITGLMSATDYEVIYREDCASGDSTGDIGPIAFRTRVAGIACTAPQAAGSLFTSGFEVGLDDGWTSTNDLGITQGAFETGPRWFINNGNTDTGSAGTGPFGPNTGISYAYMEAGGTSAANPNGDLLISPALDLSCVDASSPAQLSFFYHMAGTAIIDLQVVASTDGFVTETPLVTLTGAQQATVNSIWLETGASLAAFAGQSGVQIGFRTRTSGFSGDIAIDDVQISYCSACANIPTVTSIDNVTETTAEVSFTDPNPFNSVSYEFEVAVGNNPFTGTPTHTATTSPLNLTGLMGSTTYRVRARSVCLDGSTSCYSNPLSFSTRIGISPEQVFCFSFEDSAISGWEQSTTDDNNWSQTQNNTPTANTGPTAAFNGLSYLFTESDGNNGDVMVVSSPSIGLQPNLNDPYLSFYYHMLGNNMGALSVDIEAPIGSGNFINVFEVDGDQGARWNNVIVDLVPFVGQAISIRVTGTVGAGNLSDMAIDQFCIVGSEQGAQDADVAISDPCVCVGPTPVGINNTGEFSETVQITGLIGDTWEVTSGTGGLMGLEGSIFTQVTPGVYEFNFNHLDSVGYEGTFTSQGTGVVLSIGNTCYYPSPDFAFYDVTICQGAGVLELDLRELNGGASVSELFDIETTTGTVLLAGITSFDVDAFIAANGAGDYVLVGRFDAGTAGSENLRDPGCTTEIRRTVNIGAPIDYTGLACNDNVRVSLDDNCEALIVTDMILEDIGLCGLNFDIELLDNQGNLLPNPISGAFVGQTITVRIRERQSGNVCWGSIILEDKVAPVLECADYSVISCSGTVDPFSPVLASSVASINTFVNLPIPDQNLSGLTTDFNFSQIPAGAFVTGVTLRIARLGHTEMQDVRIEIIAPDGTTALVFNNLCGFGDNLINVAFFDGAPAPNCNTAFGGPALTGPVAPAESLADALGGVAANGVWGVRIADTEPGVTGTIDEMTLQLNYVAPTLTAVAFSDNCTPNGQLSVTFNDQVTSADCNDLTNAGVIQRNWRVTDAAGNRSTCLQTITLIRPTIDNVSIPEPIEWTCSEYAANAGIIGATPLTGVNATTGSGVPTAFGAPLATGDNCNFTVSHTDVTIDDLCVGAPAGSTFKVRRKWLVIDWCTGDEIELNQLIKVGDTEAPVFTNCPPANQQPVQVNVIAASTDQSGTHGPCVGNAVVAPRTVAADGCSGLNPNGYRTELYTIDPLTLNRVLVASIPSNGGQFNNISLEDNDPNTPGAEYIAVHFAKDRCGNESSCEYRLQLNDRVPPVAICDEITTISLDNDVDGNSCVTLFADDLDDGSYDNCGEVHFLIARVDAANPIFVDPMNVYGRCFYPSIDYCCEDVGNNQVILMVLDKDPRTAAPPAFTPNGIPDFAGWLNAGLGVDFFGCETGRPTLVFPPLDGPIDAPTQSPYYTIPTGQNDILPPLPFAAGNNGINYNVCMVDVIVEDKIGPACVFTPGNATIDCDNYFDNYETPLSLNQQAGSIVDSVLFRNFGTAEFYDNCEVDVVYTELLNIDNCGVGTVTRRWVGTDPGGRSATCSQIISVGHVSDWVVEFPHDEKILCDNASNFDLNDPATTGEPTIFFETCELIGITWEDRTFTNVPDACYKIERTWTVINWCIYDANLGNSVIESSELDIVTMIPDNADGSLPRMPDFDFRTYDPAQDLHPQGLGDENGLGDELVGGNALMTANDHLPEGTIQSLGIPNTNDARTFQDGLNLGNFNPGAPLKGATPDGYITYTQVIKVDDEQPPSLTCTDRVICEETTACGPVFADLSVNVADACSDVFRYEYEIDAFYDASTPFQADFTGTGDTSSIANGNYPIGVHLIRWSVTDRCGNYDICEFEFEVRDCKKPTPYCKNGLVIEIMQTGMVQTWASDFDAGSFDNCPGDLQFSFSDNPLDTGLLMTCADLNGQQQAQLTVNIWVTDAAGNQDFCITTVLLQDNMGACSGGTPRYDVAGATTTEYGDDVENVEVLLSGDTDATVMTSTDGAFAFNQLLNDDYTITPLKDVNHGNGVTTWDLVLIARHILGTELLDSPYKVIAADANKTNSLSAADLLVLRSLVLTSISELPNITSWRFVPANHTFVSNVLPFSPAPGYTVNNPFPEVISINNLTADQLDANFIAIKVGDVNQSARAYNALGLDDRTFNGAFVLNTADQALTAGNKYQVEFTAADIQSFGYQFTLNFDAKALQFENLIEGVAKTENFGLMATEQGVITTSFSTTEAKKFAADEVLFTLEFTAKADANLSELITVDGRYTAAEAYGSNGELLNVELGFGKGATVAAGFELLQNTPNPFGDITTIGFVLPTASDATLTIMDVTGKVLKVVDGSYVQGYNNVTVKRGELPATGVLYYQLDTPTESATKSMIIVD